MSLDNSQTTPSLPEDLKQHIENARNNLTLMEAELARLTKLSQQEKDTITSINAEKVDSQNQLDQVKKYLE
jgi:ribosome-binding protein aMBF1 (putative translation factor)